MITISAINFLGDMISVTFQLGVTDYSNDLFTILETPIVDNQTTITDEQLLDLYKLAIADFENQLSILRKN